MPLSRVCWVLPRAGSWAPGGRQVRPGPGAFWHCREREQPLAPEGREKAEGFTEAAAPPPQLPGGLVLQGTGCYTGTVPGESWSLPRPLVLEARGSAAGSSGLTRRLRLSHARQLPGVWLDGRTAMPTAQVLEVGHTTSCRGEPTVGARPLLCYLGPQGQLYAPSLGSRWDCPPAPLTSRPVFQVVEPGGFPQRGPLSPGGGGRGWARPLVKGQAAALTFVSAPESLIFSQ